MKLRIFSACLALIGLIVYKIMVDHAQSASWPGISILLAGLLIFAVTYIKAPSGPKRAIWDIVIISLTFVSAGVILALAIWENT